MIAEDAGKVSQRGIALLVLVVTAAIVLLAIASTYSAYVSSREHRNACASRKVVLDTLHDVIVLALTPAPGEKLTATQIADIQKLETETFGRIDQAYC